jgi:hypothetical protein
MSKIKFKPTIMYDEKGNIYNMKSKAYNKWKNHFNKEYDLFKEKLMQKIGLITQREFNKWKNQQLKLAKEMGVFK